MTESKKLDELCINTIRVLAAEGVEQANSGHPGAPLGMAPMAYTLFDRFLSHNPSNPLWYNRDRFVLSAGHASMLLYSLLHLTGYDLPLEQLKAFRQLGSMTPGHPEYGETPGVEMTTGPLGQGLAHSVGMAVAEYRLATVFNRPGHDIVDHFTYAIVSDGDLEEGISSEAASLAGTWKLGKLIYLYDDNDIQIDGSTDKVFTEDVKKRFKAFGWHVTGPIDGFDVEAVATAIEEAKAVADKPSMIICKTVIGFGAPAQGSSKVHGSPLGPDGIKALKAKFGWPGQAFYVPDDVKEHMRRAVERGAMLEKAWNDRFDAYRAEHPELAARFEAQMQGRLTEGWNSGLDGLFKDAGQSFATRNASGKVINALYEKLPALMGGSADLAGSTKTTINGQGDFSHQDPSGPNVFFGVREHAMGAIAGGMALHGGVIPYTGTFLTFSDYMRAPMRLAAMMKQRVVYVFTHDSIGLGEDGPTHQPIEHLMCLRAVPNLVLIRPADATETVYAWQAAVERHDGPTALVFTRQKLPVLDRSVYARADGVAKGAYVLWQADAQPRVIIMATGSEVHIALDAGKELEKQGISSRVVSMPSWELFDKQSESYRREVLPDDIRARVAVEAGTTMGWQRYTGLDGKIIGMEYFGASAPYEELYRHFGITVEATVKAAKELLG